MNRSSTVILVLSLFAAPACTLQKTLGMGEECVQDQQCFGDLRCMPNPANGRKFCTTVARWDVFIPPVETSTPPQDAAADTASDVPRADGGMDVPLDTGTDTGADTSTDTSTDTGADSGSDAGMDVGDSGTD